MAPIRPIQQRLPPTRSHHATLPAVPHTVAEARRQVRAAVRYWRVPVDIDVAALLVSELVTNAVTHDGGTRSGGAGVADGAVGAAGAAGAVGVVTLTIRGDERQLRVDVHDTSPAPPVLNDDVPASAEGGRGLLLVDSLAAAWGSYRTATGKAVYFVLGVLAAEEDG